MMTDPNHPNGSSRVAEVASKEAADVFINIQGDEPMISPEAIDKLAEVFEDASVCVATLAVRKHDFEEYQNPNVVKVVCDGKGNALYFSRSPLPYFREKPAAGISFLKHQGIYGYRREFLLDFVKWPAGELENIEKLEQLRVLQRGIPIRVIETASDSWSVDTAEDLAAVEDKMKRLAEKN
jgi:3-deoxy-manno-octulosonate cytidylyltransferase (CMP-KDO synthetase)